MQEQYHDLYICVGHVLEEIGEYIVTEQQLLMIIMQHSKGRLALSLIKPIVEQLMKERNKYIGLWNTPYAEKPNAKYKTIAIKY